MFEAATLNFIRENPLNLVFKRRTRVETNEGGWSLTSPTPLPAQEGRFVQSGRVGAAGLRHNPDGRIQDMTATIVMLPGGDVEVGDLVDIPQHGVGGDPGVEGEWEVMDITGRWAMNIEVVRHAG